MFRIAILTRPYQVPYVSYAGNDKMDILYSNFAGPTSNNPSVPVTNATSGMSTFRFTKSFAGRPLGQQ